MECCCQCGLFAMEETSVLDAFPPRRLLKMITLHNVNSAICSQVLREGYSVRAFTYSFILLRSGFEGFRDLLVAGDQNC